MSGWELNIRAKAVLPVLGRELIAKGVCVAEMVVSRLPLLTVVTNDSITSVSPLRARRCVRNLVFAHPLNERIL